MTNDDALIVSLNLYAEQEEGYVGEAMREAAARIAALTAERDIWEERAARMQRERDALRELLREMKPHWEAADRIAALTAERDEAYAAAQIASVGLKAAVSNARKAEAERDALKKELAQVREETHRLRIDAALAGAALAERDKLLQRAREALNVWLETDNSEWPTHDRKLVAAIDAVLKGKP